MPDLRDYIAMYLATGQPGGGGMPNMAQPGPQSGAAPLPNWPSGPGGGAGVQMPGWPEPPPGGSGLPTPYPGPGPQRSPGGPVSPVPISGGPEPLPMPQEPPMPTVPPVDTPMQAPLPFKDAYAAAGSPGGSHSDHAGRSMIRLARCTGRLMPNEHLISPRHSIAHNMAIAHEWLLEADRSKRRTTGMERAAPGAVVLGTETKCLAVPNTNRSTTSTL